MIKYVHVLLVLIGFLMMTAFLCMLCSCTTQNPNVDVVMPTNLSQTYVVKCNTPYRCEHTAAMLCNPYKVVGMSKSDGSEFVHEMIVNCKFKYGE